MAAVVIPSPTSFDPAHRPDLQRRPDLRVIHGGRSAVHRGMQRVYLRRRLVAGLAVVLFTIVVWMAVVGALSLARGPAAESSSAATAAVPPAAAEAYIVQPGDTLWTIAERLDPDGDLRPVVDELADRAGGPALQAGQRIDVRGLAG